jgi:hypothetical protein
MYFLTISNISLYLQFLILLGLIVGYIFLKRKRIVHHGYIMFIMYTIHIISVFVVMIPSAINIIGNLNFTNMEYMTVVHGILGGIVLVLSSIILLSWRFRKPGAKCYKMKKFMLVLIILWIVEISLGIVEYYMLYLL